MYGIHLRADSAMHWYIGPASTQWRFALKLSKLPFLGSCSIYFKICRAFLCLFLFTMQLRITCVLFEFPLDINLFDWTDGERKS